jgi:hypothetical protein
MPDIHAWINHETGLAGDAGSESASDIRAS